MIGSFVKSCGQENLSDDGKRSLDDGIRSGLDREYPDWKNPEGTHMVPDFFPTKDHSDRGENAEWRVYTLLEQLGKQNNERMFVVHSYDFSEHIPGSGRKRSWVMGETDFVIVHRHHGPIYIQVKASETNKSYKEAEEQLRKDKLALQKRFQDLVKAVKGKISTNQVTELFKNFPAFVAMPNCPKDGSFFVQDNVLYQEDCSSLDAFAKWWNEKITNAEHPAVNQRIYEYLVMRFVGMSHLKPFLGFCFEHEDKMMIYQTKKQMEILSKSSPAKLWIRGPAGSGKTYLLIEKVVKLAEDILFRQADENILIVCFNSVLCKALEQTLKNYFPNVEDLSSDLHVHLKTFTKLVVEVANLSHAPKTNKEKEESVDLALKCLGRTCNCMFDHILVDEGQDLYGKNWPKLLEKMHKSSQVPVDPKDEFLSTLGCFWVMYDLNQHLYFAKEQAKMHFEYLINSSELSEVLRNTENVFKQSKKYFESLMSNDHPITLGHQIVGQPIRWDDSLVARSGEEIEGGNAVSHWVKKLQEGKVQPRDICILVENQEKRQKLQAVLSWKFGQKTQTGDNLVGRSDNCVVVESIRCFKGIESKVVILYNPPFQDDPSINTKELLYTAVSRCSCFLIVITTKEGCKALKSDVGVNQESSKTRQHLPRFSQPAAWETEQKWQMHEGYLDEPFQRGNADSQYESGPPEFHPKQPKVYDNNFHEGVFNPAGELNLSQDDMMMYERQDELRKKRAANNQPRPMEVDGSKLRQPGDRYIQDKVRENVFILLSGEVEQNLKYIPCDSEMDLRALNVETIIADMEYEVYQKRKADCRPNNYTCDLRKLKEEIKASNSQKKCHDSVMTAFLQRAGGAARLYK